jgi:hypothetical protein
MQYLLLLGFLLMFSAFAYYHHHQLKALEKRLTTKPKSPSKKKAPPRKKPELYQMLLPFPNLMLEGKRDQAILDAIDGKKSKSVLFIGDRR